MYKIRLYIIVHNSVKLKWVNLNSGYHMIGKVDFSGDVNLYGDQ